jgi:hypothetical protein
LAALIAGFKTLKITAAEAHRLNVKMTGSTPVRAHAIASEGSIVPTKTNDPTSEIVIETAPAFSAEQEGSGGE